jgi:hypothetical protein
MSKALNIADEMAVYLRTLDALDGIEVQPPISSSHNALDHFTQKANS